MATTTDRRFQFPTGGDTEYAEQYRPGGLHPVLLGDDFNERYRIVLKLGFGGFSTVWLSIDEHLKRYVALKIVEAKSSKEGPELKLLTSLDQTINHPGKRHVQQLLDHFEHEGPNGRHQCLVFEPMGRNFNQYLWDYEWEERKGWSAFDGPSRPRVTLPLHFTRHLCKQLLIALDYLHSQKIMHRDIQPGNILFAPSSTIDDNDYEADAWEIVPKRVDGQPLGDGDPKYLLEAEPLKDGVPVTAPPNFRIVLSDLGSASTFEDSNDGLHTYPFLLQAPEVLLKLPFDEKADIWNLGCVIFEILFGTRPFSTGNVFGTGEDNEDGLLKSFVECLGPMPQHLWSKVPRPLETVDASGSLREHTPEDLEMNCRYYNLREVMELRRVKDMSDAEFAAFEAFIRSTLQYEPGKRPSTQELLQHPWFVNF